MVDNEVTLTYDQLLAMPLVEQYVTIACVSNEVGGHLVGNAKWTGVNLNSVLAMAGVQAGATQVVGRSFDGWTSGFPTEHLSGAGKDAMIVVQMNGEPLPARHGFPARLIVPGLYGYVSATKWVTEIELTTLEAFDAYWIKLGWAKEGPDPDPVADRHAALGPGHCPTARSSSPALPGHPRAASPRSRSTSTTTTTGAPASYPRRCPTTRGSSGRRRCACRRASTGPCSGDRRHGHGAGVTQTPPAPDGARGYHTVMFIATCGGRTPPAEVARDAVRDRVGIGGRGEGPRRDPARPARDRA